MLYIFGTLHWQQLGYSTTWCGLLWAISIVSEIIARRTGRNAPSLSGGDGPIHR